MTDFFDYRPIILGLVFDLDDPKNLARVKAQFIELARTFTADTEDKIYVYHPDVRQFDQHISEGIAQIANWRKPEGSLDWGDGPFLEKSNPRLGLMRCHRMLSDTSPEDRRHIFLITDRNDKMALGSVGKVCQYISRDRNPNLRVTVIGIGNVPDFLTSTSLYTFADFHYLNFVLDLTKEKLQEIIDG